MSIFDGVESMRAAQGGADFSAPDAGEADGARRPSRAWLTAILLFGGIRAVLVAPSGVLFTWAGVPARSGASAVACACRPASRRVHLHAQKRVDDLVYCTVRCLDVVAVGIDLSSAPHGCLCAVGDNNTRPRVFCQLSP